jgi:hypothetical protein
MTLLSFVSSPLAFHLLFGIALVYIGRESLKGLSIRTFGMARDDLFTGAFIAGLAGIGFWILHDLTSYSVLYRIGKSLVFYGFIHLASLAIFIRTFGSDEGGGLRKSLLLYLLTFAIEIVADLTRPLPEIATAGVRGAITLWWIGGMIRPFRNPEKSADYAFRILYSIFYSVGMIGYAISRESGTHHAHYFFAAAALPLLLQAAGRRIAHDRIGSRTGVAVIGLVLMAGLTRATAKHLDDIFQTGIILNTHLAYASVLFLIAVPVYLYLIRREGRGESDI